MYKNKEFAAIEDKELVHITLEGNDLAFNELVQRYQEPILRYCKSILNL